MAINFPKQSSLGCKYDFVQFWPKKIDNLKVTGSVSPDTELFCIVVVVLVSVILVCTCCTYAYCV